MESTYRDWKNLPAELLHKILQLAAIEQSKAEFCNIALVCKAWKSTVLAVAYSDITIKTISQFIQFYNVIRQNPQLGLKIRSLDLLFNQHLFPNSDEMEGPKQLTSLLATSLPNLEVLNKDNLHSWVPTLSALLDVSLKKLRRLQLPDRFRGYDKYDKYVDCALMMKERLENIYIYHIKPQQYENLNVDYQRLYNSLYHFNNLVDITLVIETSNSVQVLEYVVESSKFLKKLKVWWYFPDDMRPDIPMNDLLKYNARSSVESLTFGVHRGTNDHNLLIYIMHKFAKLKSLVLYLQAEDPHPSTHMVAKFLDYMSTVGEILVYGLSVNQSNPLEIILNHWQNTTKPGSEKLQIIRSIDCPQNITTSLDIKKDNVEGNNEFTLRFPANTDFDWTSYLDFIEKGGKYIDTLSFYNEEDDGGRYELPEIFFPQTLTYCSNIKSLCLKRCDVKQFYYSEANLNKKFSISELYLKYCEIQHGSLEQLSPFIHEIEQLWLCNNTGYYFEDVLADTPNVWFLQIDMPYTIISRIVIAVKRYSDVFYVKVLVLDNEKCYYYKISDNRPDDWLSTTTEEEYVAINNHQHVYITCLTKPTIKVKLVKHMWA